jgi:hypothetical protein
MVYAVGFACLGGKEGDYVDGHFGEVRKGFLGVRGWLDGERCGDRWVRRVWGSLELMLARVGMEMGMLGGAVWSRKMPRYDSGVDRWVFTSLDELVVYFCINQERMRQSLCARTYLRIHFARLVDTQYDTNTTRRLNRCKKAIQHLELYLRRPNTARTFEMVIVVSIHDIFNRK